MRIWFNHWFSTAYHYINQIKDAFEDTCVIGTNKKPECVYFLVCDEHYLEPEEDTLYVDWCLNFCKEHKIDIFMPRRQREEIAKRIGEFEAIGVKVMVETNCELVETLKDKIKTAQLFKELDININIPEMLVATNVLEFKGNYVYLKKKYPHDRVCFKYAVDEGAVSFRVIDDSMEDISSLRKGIGHKMSYQKAVEMFSQAKTFDPIIMMIYLDGIEISIDSLMTSKGFIGCARYKLGTRGSVVDTTSPLIDISKEFAEKTGIKHPYNLQVRYHNNTPYLLEVNTRLAGGTYKDSFTGMNFAYFAICDLIGKDFKIPEEKTKLIVSQIETPLLIRGDEN